MPLEGSITAPVLPPSLTEEQQQEQLRNEAIIAAQDRNEQRAAEALDSLAQALCYKLPSSSDLPGCIARLPGCHEVRRAEQACTAHTTQQACQDHQCSWDKTTNACHWLSALPSIPDAVIQRSTLSADEFKTLYPRCVFPIPRQQPFYCDPPFDDLGRGCLAASAVSVQPSPSTLVECMKAAKDAKYMAWHDEDKTCRTSMEPPDLACQTTQGTIYRAKKDEFARPVRYALMGLGCFPGLHPQPHVTTREQCEAQRSPYMAWDEQHQACLTSRQPPTLFSVPPQTYQDAGQGCLNDDTALYLQPCGEPGTDPDCDELEACQAAGKALGVSAIAYRSELCATGDTTGGDEVQMPSPFPATQVPNAASLQRQCAEAVQYNLPGDQATGYTFDKYDSTHSPSYAYKCWGEKASKLQRRVNFDKTQYTTCAFDNDARFLKQGCWVGTHDEASKGECGHIFTLDGNYVDTMLQQCTASDSSPCQGAPCLRVYQDADYTRGYFVEVQPSDKKCIAAEAGNPRSTVSSADACSSKCDADPTCLRYAYDGGSCTLQTSQSALVACEQGQTIFARQDMVDRQMTRPSAMCPRKPFDNLADCLHQSLQYSNDMTQAKRNCKEASRYVTDQAGSTLGVKSSTSSMDMVDGFRINDYAYGNYNSPLASETHADLTLAECADKCTANSSCTAFESTACRPDAGATSCQPTTGTCKLTEHVFFSAAPLTDCSSSGPHPAGDAQSTREQHVGNTDTMQECIDKIKDGWNTGGDTPNAVTWGKDNKACYAEYGAVSVGASTKYQTCGINHFAWKPGTACSTF